jgi:hypothetical protein
MSAAKSALGVAVCLLLVYIEVIIQQIPKSQLPQQFCIVFMLLQAFGEYFYYRINIPVVILIVITYMVASAIMSLISQFSAVFIRAP